MFPCRAEGVRKGLASQAQEADPYAEGSGEL